MNSAANLTVSRATALSTLFAICGLWVCSTGSAQTKLTLPQAMELALAEHPEIKALDIERTRVEADIDIARLAPPTSAKLEAENLGADSSEEYTLSLERVLERRGKRNARISVGTASMDVFEREREAARLDLLAEVARRYLDVLLADAAVRINEDESRQLNGVIEAASRRVTAGASPESVRLTAEATKAHADLQLARAKRERDAKLRQLLLLWTDQPPAATEVSGDLLTLPAVPDFVALTQFLARSPELTKFADERRLREARLQLSRAERTRDVTVSLGVRRLESEGEWAAVAGVSVPLGSRTRSSSGIRASQAELDALEFRQKGRELTLLATLTEAHATFTAGKEEVEQIDRIVLPGLTKAEQASARAFRAGALGYLEWAQVQAELIEVRREQVAAAFRAHQALIEIQRLTGDPFTKASTAPETSR